MWQIIKFGRSRECGAFVMTLVTWQEEAPPFLLPTTQTEGTADKPWRAPSLGT